MIFQLASFEELSNLVSVVTKKVSHVWLLIVHHAIKCHPRNRAVTLASCTSIWGQAILSAHGAFYKDLGPVWTHTWRPLRSTTQRQQVIKLTSNKIISADCVFFFQIHLASPNTCHTILPLQQRIMKWDGFGIQHSQSALCQKRPWSHFWTNYVSGSVDDLTDAIIPS